MKQKYLLKVFIVFCLVLVGLRGYYTVVPNEGLAGQEAWRKEAGSFDKQKQYYTSINLAGFLCLYLFGCSRSHLVWRRIKRKWMDFT